MVTIKRANDGKILLTSSLPIDKEVAVKLDNKELQNKIDAICKDLHLDAYCVSIDDNVPFSVVDRYVTETNEAGISALTETHQKFIHAIESVEVSDDTEDGVDEIDKEFVMGFLENLQSDDDILGADVMIPGLIPGTIMSCGMRLTKKSLIQLCECYIDNN